MHLLFLKTVFVFKNSIILSIFILNLLSTSKKIGLAPKYKIGLIVAINVNDCTKTSSSLLMLATTKARWIAEVPLFNATAYLFLTV